MSNNRAIYEIISKQFLRSILDISAWLLIGGQASVTRLILRRIVSNCDAVQLFLVRDIKVFSWKVFFHLSSYWCLLLLDFQTAVRIASSNEDSTPTCVYHTIMRGLERLVVSFALSSAESDSLVKLSVDRWVSCNLWQSCSRASLSRLHSCSRVKKERI